MRLHVHDFSGHPFQVELSRTLARLGDVVEHSYCDQYVSGKGTMTVGAADPPTLSISAVHGSRTFDKYHPVRRSLFEITFARDLWRTLRRRPVDAVVLCNAPLISTFLVAIGLRRRRVRWVFWHQDVYSMGMRDELTRRLPAPVASVLGRVFTRMERYCVAGASAVVAIDDAFVACYREWGLDAGNVVVIPNWAPLDEIGPVARDNEWAAEAGLPESSFRLLYSGTLGRKHNPLLLLRLLDLLRERGVTAHLTVVSEGDGVEQLREHADPGRVTILPFQPAGRLSEVLSSADVLTVLLEPRASQFSIPSKVLSYLAAGRPIVGLMPAGNTASTYIRAVGSITADPDERRLGEVADSLAALARDGRRRVTLGENARAHAEREFDVNAVAERFRDLLRSPQRQDALS